MDSNHRLGFSSSNLVLHREEVPALPTELLLLKPNYSTTSLLCAIFFLLCCIFATLVLTSLQSSRNHVASLHIPPSLNPSYSPIQLNSFQRTLKPAFKAFVAFLWIRDATWGYTESTVPDHLITRTRLGVNFLIVPPRNC